MSDSDNCTPVDLQSDFKDDDIAVIGMSCRFPGAENYHEFWDNLHSGQYAVSEIPKSRWDWEEYFGDPQSGGNKTNIKWGGFISDIDKFDPKFFNISPREATYMDPQHRIFLQSVWHAIEDSGYSPKSLSGRKIGVYAAVSKFDYAELSRQSDSEIASFTSTGMAHSILANRVSYLLNLNGPSQMIDTACSGALVSIHNAINAIHSGECELAISGGVNALITPTIYISHSKSGMLALDGKCKSFDSKANGYVRGEGVGAVILKPLSQALKDNDSIHAVIKGSAVNHGGNANTLTSPSVKGQSEVIIQAFERAKVHPNTITYIEAHGTGTPLGDPVEINGLKKAFSFVASQESGSEAGLNHNYCGIGSAKTYIGHLEAASGMAGIIKVIMSMKNARVPRLLHFEKINPHIQLDESPFFIAKNDQPWERIRLDGQIVPLRVGVSSFGMGGVNGHVILQEPPVPVKDDTNNKEKTGQPVLVVLSAQGGQLKKYAQDLKLHFEELQKNGFADQIRMLDIAYTLQVGRNQFDERLAIIARNIQELIEKLNELDCLTTPVSTGGGIWINTERKKRVRVEEGLVNSLISKSDLGGLADIWVKGGEFTWSGLYESVSPRRVPLTVYPFVKRRCWIDTKNTVKDSPVVAGQLHPLIDTNTSTSNNVRFTKRLSLNDFFIQDHVVSGTPMLPGVTCFDMAMEAAKIAYPEKAFDKIQDLFWLAPIRVTDKSADIEIRLSVDQGVDNFEVHSKDCMHYAGKLVSSGNKVRVPSALDLDSIRARCTRVEPVDSLYQKFFDSGLNYGPTFRAISKFSYSDSEAFSELILPVGAKSYPSESQMHPSLMDGAFQSAVGLTLLGLSETSRQFVPFCLQEISIYRPLTQRCFVHVSTDIGLDDDMEKVKFTLFITDESGNVLIEISDFVKRALKPKEGEKNSDKKSEDNYYYQVYWKNTPLQSKKAIDVEGSVLLFLDDKDLYREFLSNSSIKGRIILIESGKSYAQLSDNNFSINPTNGADYQALLNTLKSDGVKVSNVLYFWSYCLASKVRHNIKGIKEYLDKGIYSILNFTQGLMKSRNFQKVKLYCVYDLSEKFEPVLASTVAGFARTQKYENPNLDYRIIGLDRKASRNIPAILIKELLSENTSGLNNIRYIGDSRSEENVKSFSGTASHSNESLLRKNGVYLITGGMGGLGYIFAQHLAKTHSAKLILLGRSPANEKIESKIKELASLGGEAIYQPADVARRVDIKAAIKVAKSHFGGINGIVHAAGLIDDGFIFLKNREVFSKVISPKVFGAFNLDRATRNEDLDFFMVFSSIAAIIPNQGQCDYASGNCFLDAFSDYRNSLLKSGGRSGKTVAINWPLWASGGMQVFPEEEEHLRTVFGMNALPTEIGIRVFDQVLGAIAGPKFDAEMSQVIVIDGDREKIAAQFGINVTDESKNKEVSNPSIMESEMNLEVVVNHILAANFEQDPNALDAYVRLEEFAIDSVNMVKLCTELNNAFEIKIKPTMFFEVSTLGELYDFIKNQNPKSPPNYTADYADKAYSLVDVDQSDLVRKVFRKTFTNEEFYQIDHVVNGKYNVPGACFVEMGRQVGEIIGGGRRVQKLRNNYWAKQLSSLGEAFTAHIHVVEKDGFSEYKIVSIDVEGTEEIHAMGEVVFDDVCENATPEALDFDEIRARCTQTWAPEKVYESIIAEGLHVGPTFMPMQEIFLNADEALAHLIIPPQVEDTQSEYLLHPTTLTGVFQTALISNRFAPGREHQYIPIAIDELEMIEQTIPGNCYIYSQAHKANKKNVQIKKYNLSICDESGKVLVILKNFAIRALPNSAKVVASVSSAVATKPQVGGDALRVKTETFLKTLLAEAIETDPEDIDSEEEFDKFGINSVMIMALNRIFENKFGPLSKTLFFEYRNVEDLAEYFMDKHSKTLMQMGEVGQGHVDEAKQVENTERVKTQLVDQVEEQNNLSAIMVEQYIKQLIAKTIEVDPSEIDSEDEFETFGINSVMIMSMNRLFEDSFGSLSKTLFFEYRCVEDLAKYFLEDHKETLENLLCVAKPIVHQNTVSPLLTESPKTATASLIATVKTATPDPIELAAAIEGEEEIARHANGVGDIAIIGLDGRYPESDTMGEFWEMMTDGRDCVSTIPKDRFDYLPYFDPDKKNNLLYAKWGGFINDVDRFDPLFFNISPREAELIDPQERLFLQVAWGAVEDAGYTRKSLKPIASRVGVFVGALWQPYQIESAVETQRGNPIGSSGLLYSIANRVSYVFDFQGPSMAIDTACSSSLTALHMACESIKTGECDAAVVGGVNLSMDLSKYLFLSQYRFLASDGRCRSFGDGGDGYVPGEGIGAVMLKPLAAAIENKDHVYGVIKGTAVNHGGKTNGYTVPNPNAQASLIKNVLEKSAVDSRSISYIEAHGTGTALGDPIEIAGLSKAFSSHTSDKQYCAIGSLKSNIGHLEAAAGIASLSKVLLQMKHKQLVPSIHSKTLNSNIDFTKTPFTVQQELAAWQKPQIEVDGKMQEFPRIAGVSSFGAGGSNAHVLIEEYSPSVDPDVGVLDGPVVLPVSAKNDERLKAYCQRILDFLVQPDSNHKLQNIAYTFQVGREEMEYRVAFVAGSVADLVNGLERFIADEQKISGVYRRPLSGHSVEVEQKWYTQRDFDAVASAWASGAKINWNKFYIENQPSRVSAPTYPFSKERYWLPKGEQKQGLLPGASSGARTVIHPLLHENTSNLSEQRYTSTFSGQEHFLKEHVVKGEIVLPGVAILEMARAAIDQATEAYEEQKLAIRLSNVVFLRPIVIHDGPVTVHISLFPEEDQQISFEIYSKGTNAENEWVVHTQGRGELTHYDEQPQLDIAAIRNGLNKDVTSSGACYQMLRDMGFAYGDGYQAVEKVYQGDATVLGKLRLPDSLSGSCGDYVLHPSMMDSSLHSTLCLAVDMTKTITSRDMLLPFAVEQLTVFGPCRENMWASVRYANGSAPGDRVLRFDIDLCDEKGALCMSMRGYSGRLLEGVVGSGGHSTPTENNAAVMVQPKWRRATAAASNDVNTLDYAARIVVLCTEHKQFFDNIKANLPENHCVLIDGIAGESADEGYRRLSESLFVEIQKSLTSKTKGKTLFQVVMPSNGEWSNYAGSGLAALVKTARLESANFIGQVVEYEGSDARTLSSILEESACYPGDVHVRYTDSRRFVASWDVLDSAKEPSSFEWKDDGVYLITGGGGGLGMIFAREIAKSATKSTLILTGRSLLKDSLRVEMDSIRALGAHVEYLQIDASQKGEMEGGVRDIQRKHGRVNGVIHAAGVLRDGFIINKHRDDWNTVLEAKVKGLVNLDEATRDISLDFFVCFSSIAASIGNAAQSDYATANAFMDRYSEYRNNLVSSGKRSGQTLSINWPLWKDGGMQVDQHTEAMLLKNMGMVPMNTQVGIKAFKQGLALSLDQMMVIEGDSSVIKNKLFSTTVGMLSSLPSATRLEQQSRVEEDLQGFLARLLDVNVADIDLDLSFEEFGLDRGLLPQLSEKLAQTYQLQLNVPDYMMYPTLQSLVGYILEQRGEVSPNVVSEQASVVEQQIARNTRVDVATVESDLSEKIGGLLTRIISKILKIKPIAIDGNAEFNSYGFDSITLTEFSNELNSKHALALTPTLFFEHPSLNQLVEFLATEHYAKFAGATAGENSQVHNSSTEMASNTVEESSTRQIGKRKSVRFSHRLASTTSNTKDDAVAIIGMSGKFPMAENVDELWQNLLAGKDCISEIPGDRWSWEELYGDPNVEPNKSLSKWGGFIDGVADFDAAFFANSPREALLMDPQQRLLMTYAWKAMEDAGYSSKSLAGTDTAMFVGTAGSGYNQLLNESGVDIDGYSSTGSVGSVGPNRMSYFLDIHGPSEPIETACSSSLVAINRAVEAITSGTCKMAITGGVNTLVIPELHLSFSKAGMLCSDGRCKTFSKNANGYVRGEGVGIFLLKSLSEAEKDGDHIYGVIRGSAENHGGRANSLTAPNPKAQAELLKNAWSKSGIDPRTVSYIEAHGTGTALGDPIEVNALKSAFKDLYKGSGSEDVKEAHIGLGSIKANIGHLEFAAGAASVIKVLLQLKHKTLVKSLHAEHINPYIQLDNTPFYILQDTQEWVTQKDENGNDLPRRAGVSSFGFGGANAHIVIEEYQGGSGSSLGNEQLLNRPSMILLSAKNENRLKASAEQLLQAIRNERYSEKDLARIAYTLQVGRDAMDVRLATMVSTLSELEEKLSDYLQGEEPENFYFGHIKTSKDTLSVFGLDDDLRAAVSNWLAKGKYGKLLNLWVKGLEVNWNDLYGENRLSKISLPSYPFDYKRYWPATRKGAADVLHPLLHRNTSDFGVQKFSSRFTGQEFFFADHVLAGQKILPGVTYLEMARQAVQEGLGGQFSEELCVHITNVIWERPIIIDDSPISVHIVLYPEENDSISFEIYSSSVDVNEQIHCTGLIFLDAYPEETTWDIDALKSSCTQDHVSKQVCYQTLQAQGLSIGERLRGIEEMHLGSKQMLVKLGLPATIADTSDLYQLHPSLLDSPLQSTVSLTRHSREAKLNVPFTLGTLEILKNFNSAVWAVMRYSDGTVLDDQVRDLDIDWCDENGAVCARMLGYSTRSYNTSAGNLATLTLQPQWQEALVDSGQNAKEYEDHHILLLGMEKTLSDNVKALADSARCVVLSGIDQGDNTSQIGEQFQACAESVFLEIKQIISQKLQGKTLFQVVFQGEGKGVFYSALSGLIKTVGLESSKCHAQLIDTDSVDGSEIIEQLFESASCKDQIVIRYRDSKRWTQGWKELSDASATDSPVSIWQDEGVYLITGGVGALGLLLAQEIASKCHGATIVLTGRSLLSQAKVVELDSIRQLGATVDYQQMDVADFDSVATCINGLCGKYNGISGVIHNAGVLRDSLIVNKGIETLREVMLPKVAGLNHLDEATKQLDLDFMLLFSSITSALGNAAQADYALANGFMDSFASYRNQLTASGKRKGHSLVINWPLWKDGGMRVDEQTAQILEETLGMVAMDNATGFSTIEKGLNAQLEQMLVMQGHPEKLKKLFSLGLPLTENTVTSTSISTQQLQRVVQKFAADVLDVNHNEIMIESDMAEYGFDPALLAEFTEKLNSVYDLNVSTSTINEYANLEAITDYLLVNYADAFVTATPVEEKAVAQHVQVTPEHKPEATPKKSVNDTQLQQKVYQVLQNLACTILKTDQASIDGDADFNDYGFDSLALTEFSRMLNREYKLGVSPAIFFEYSTLHKLSAWLSKEHTEVFSQQLNVESTPVAALAGHKSSNSKVAFNIPRRRTPRIAKMSERSRGGDFSEPQPIAIVGMSGKFPQANDIDEFWQNLLDGSDCISEVPEDRWSWEALYGDPDLDANLSNIKWGGFIDGIGEFDPLFFGISPSEAERMDPRQRLMMTYIWKVIEDAGYAPNSLSGSNTAIFVGTSEGGYNHLVTKADLPIKGYSATGSISSIGPNRMSYFLNLHGPSEPVETACSSSLVAIHHAVNAIRSGACSEAIVGAVNTIVSPDMHISFNKAGMLSEDGRCKTFSKDANGYVRGEGVGMLFLKPLDEAEAAKDHIYGVIRATSENHGGKSNSLTAPNPNAQAQLISGAYQQNGIDPSTIGYIEAHGTGTPLGDPVEINGLKQAFKTAGVAQPTVSNANCGLGSVKSNIGHLELAAGIAGMIKALLQIKHQTLVKSLHCEDVNPYISLTETPFYIVQENKKWERLKDTDGRTLPLRAGVSSFGFGGVNSHVVVEEYIAKNDAVQSVSNTNTKPAIVVLSAMSDQLLREQAELLISALHSGEFDESSLSSIAFTLQTGRKVMDYRLALLVSTIDDLSEKLQSFIDSAEAVVCVWQGGSSIKPIAGELPSSEAVQEWIEQGDYDQLSSSWVKGLDVNWTLLYQNVFPSKVRLPTYPFARENYWISPAVESQKGTYAKPEAVDDTAYLLHPLLHKNISDFQEQRFSSTLTGEEFFFEDHKVKGQKVLPGVATLEMVRAAVAESLRGSDESSHAIRITRILWSRPIIAGDAPIEVYVGLHPETGESISFRVYSEISGVEQLVYVQGVVNIDSAANSERGPDTVMIGALKEQCDRRVLSAELCYGVLDSAGLQIGPSLQGISSVYSGVSQQLVKLQPPLNESPTKHGFVFHPKLMDSPLQSGLFLTIPEDEVIAVDTARKLAIPFALECLEIYGEFEHSAWAWVRYQEGWGRDDSIQKIRVTWLLEDGTVTAEMIGLSARKVDAHSLQLASQGASGILQLQPHWQSQPVSAGLSPVDVAEHLILLCDHEVLKESIEGIFPTAEVAVAGGDNPLARELPVGERYQLLVGNIIETLRHLFSTKQKGKILFQVVVSGEGEGHLFLGLSGLLKTAALENTNFIGQLIEVGAGDEIGNILNENFHHGKAGHIRYQENERFVKSWKEIETGKVTVTSPWKNGGVYLITGGAGGLGLLLAGEIVSQVKDATLILTGRSSLNETQAEELTNLRQQGAVVVYHQADVGDLSSVEQLIQHTMAEQGRIDGIIHGAGVIRDNYILKKFPDEVAKVLLPKVKGLVNLDYASRDVELEFIVAFSSVAAGVGNPGQADYAAANSFMDAFAQHRNQLVSAGQRSGHTLSVNWPLWKEGGMRVDPQTEKMMLDTVGAVPMQRQVGLNTLYRAMSERFEQIMVLEGNLPRLRQAIGLTAAATQHSQVKSNDDVRRTSGSVKEQALALVKETLQSVVKLEPSKIQLDKPFDQYGIDSIVQMDVIRKLEKVTGKLSKTILFENSNVSELVEFLAENHPNHLSAETPSTPEVPKNEPVWKRARVGTINLPKQSRFNQKLYASNEQGLHDEDIAIIGISGRYPGADSLDELWENLKAAKNCISKVPESRWKTELLELEQEASLKAREYFGGFLKSIDHFDSNLFDVELNDVYGYSPEVRLFLEIVWETLENAGYSRQALQTFQNDAEKTVGVFVGSMYQQYPWSMQSKEEAMTVSNGTDWQVANKTSHFFGLNGPSMAINSACSSSMTAIHQACESLRQQGCDMAIAGGVNLTLHPSKYNTLGGLGFLSENSLSKSFGDGDGYIPGEGVGAVLLKPLSIAQRDNDRIDAVIKSSVVNHCGRRQKYMAPDPKQQTNLILNSLKRSGLEASQISYVESAANGSPLGDSIEVVALNKAFSQSSKEKQFCALGSVKSNLGHLEAASGISQLSKVVLQLKNKMLVPSINASPRNPNIRLESSPFYLQESNEHWKTPVGEGVGQETPRRAMINSFGAGGTYANVIVEEYQGRLANSTLENEESGQQLFVFSAATPSSLNRYFRKMQGFLIKESSVDVATVGRSLRRINHGLPVRAAILASTSSELIEKLELARQCSGNQVELGIYRSNELTPQEAEWENSTLDKLLDVRDYKSLSELWVSGEDIQWLRLDGDSNTPFLALPGYAFDHDFDFTTRAKITLPDTLAEQAHNSVVEHTMPAEENDLQEILDKTFDGSLSEDQFISFLNEVKGPNLGFK